MSLCPTSRLSIFRKYLPDLANRLHVRSLECIRWVTRGAVLICALIPSISLAGGSGLNTIVVINQSSSNSCEVANYYCERRQVPPDNVLRIFWPGDNISWTSSDLQNTLLQPLLALISNRQLTNQADYVVLSMDIPYKIINGSTPNSTTTALFYGLVTSTSGSANSYSASEADFRVSHPTLSPGYSFLATMITGRTVAEAEYLIDQGATSDGTLPTDAVILEKTSDTSRNIRYPQFDNAVFNVRVLARSQIARITSDTLPAWSGGLQTGLPNFSIGTNAFPPGAIADSLTSYGGVIFGASGQTSLFGFTEAGAAGSYGTVDEPYSDPQKFPAPLVYFYQARGFTTAESYYQSLAAPYLGLTVGDPLAAPFAVEGQGKWSNLTSNAVLTGISPFALNFSGPNRLQQIDLFVDGKFFKTLTNIVPAAGNVLSVTFDGFSVAYTVPTNATLTSIATGLTSLLNNSWNSSSEKVQALAKGDRVELRSLSTNYLDSPYHFFDTAPGGVTNAAYKVVYSAFPNEPQIKAMSPGADGAFRSHLESIPGVPFQILASTNLIDWVTLTNYAAGGALDFTDPASVNLPQRYYRVAAPDQHPILSLASEPNPGSIRVHVASPTSLAYTLLASTNMQDWSTIYTNLSGQDMDFDDAGYNNFSARFYRVALVPPSLPAPNLTVVTAPSGGNLVNVSDPSRAYILLRTTNQTQWTPVLTNTVLNGGWVSTSSSAGTNSILSTYISAIQPRFMGSPAAGYRNVSVSGSVQIGTWISLTVYKTNATSVTVSVTNQTGGTTISGLAQQLYNAINLEPALQGSDGAFGDDFATDVNGTPSFHLYARSSGLDAANAQAQLASTSGLSLAPGSKTSLNQNLNDLRPRDHVYLTVGQTSLAVSNSLDTTLLSDGYHDLTAVAYEGSSVRTQTRISLPVQIQNSTLTARLTLLDLPDTAPVQGTYHLEVAANTNSVTSISLYSTGGLLAHATFQSDVTFAISGTSLGVGLHQFYAVVQTADGLSYRTEPQWVRFTADSP